MAYRRKKRELKAGDIVSIDCGVVLDGYYGDAAITVPVSDTVKPELRKLLTVTEESLYRVSIRRASELGGRRGACGAGACGGCRLQRGSGIRRSWDRTHCTKSAGPNYGARGHGAKLREGMVIAIEPMVNFGKPETRVLGDKWTAVTADGSFSAHLNTAWR